MSGVSDREMDCPWLFADIFPVAMAQLALVVAFDTLVVSLTFYKTYRLTRDARRAGVRSSLGEVILRDGGFRRLLRSSPPTD